jgi:hypothetical protein
MVGEAASGPAAQPYALGLGGHTVEGLPGPWFTASPSHPPRGTARLSPRFAGRAELPGWDRATQLADRAGLRGSPTTCPWNATHSPVPVNFPTSCQAPAAVHGFVRIVHRFNGSRFTLA